MRIALQLYTLRELAAADMLGVLEEVSRIGFAGVELAGLNGVSAAEIADTCNRLGLEICGSHIALPRFESEPEVVAHELGVLGTKHLVFPSLPTGVDGIDSPPGLRLRNAVARAKQLGLVAAFHNHRSEFARAHAGERLWDAIVAVPDLELELDLGWAWVAGEDIEALLRSCAGRCRSIHVKDHRRAGDGAPDTAVGDGEIDYAPVVREARAAGVEWLVIEQDEPGAEALDAVRRSFEFLEQVLTRVTAEEVGDVRGG